MQERDYDELTKLKAVNSLFSALKKGEDSVKKQGWTSAEEVEAELGISVEAILDLYDGTDDFLDTIRHNVALLLYQNKKASLEYCAEIADMSKEDFIKYLGENKVSIFDFESEEEFMKEIKNAKLIFRAYISII